MRQRYQINRRKHSELGAFVGIRNALLIEIVTVALLVGCCMVANSL